jgi:hypothetical protein
LRLLWEEEWSEWRRNWRYKEWLIGPAISADIAGCLTACFSFTNNKPSTIFFTPSE